MRYVLTQKDRDGMEDGEEVHLHTLDNEGYHWTKHTVVLDEVWREEE